MTLLQADQISVRDRAGRILLHPVSLTLAAGAPVVVLGETGSGKSLLAQAIMGTLPGELVAAGQVTIDGQTLDAAAPAGFRALWGRQISVLPQEPWLSLDPLMRARRQVAETHGLVRGLAPAQAGQAADADLATLDLADAGGKYPHQLSGGMAQRVAFAAARAGGARIVIADEPTKGLDAARRDEVARLLLEGLGRDGGLLVITHDLQLARRIGGTCMVIRDGAVVEAGPTARLFAAPQAAYTQRLLAADPGNWPARPPAAAGTALLSVEDLSLRRGDRVLAQGISLTVAAGQVLGVYGASGCGKSTFGDVLLGLHPAASGRVRQLVQAPRTAFQKLYQDPVAAFAPKRVLGRSLRDVAQRVGKDSGRIAELLEKLSLSPDLLQRLPGQVSGGELQRLALLRVLLTDPRLIFADEPTSRLDPLTQQQVIDLLAQVAHNGCAVVLVSHDGELLEKVSDQRFDFPRRAAAGA